MIKLKGITGHRKLLKRIFVSAAIATLILLTNYILGNWFSFLFDDSLLLSVVQSVLPNKHHQEEDVVYFNVGFDKQLVAIRDEYGDSIGNAVITDRSILSRFLDIAKRADYRYIFFDVRFEKGFDSDSDSLLFAHIKSIPRIVISTHSENGNYEIATQDILPKVAYADYYSTYFSGFTKYAYLQNGKESVALRMFQDLDNGKIDRIGLFFFFHGRLCNNHQFLTFSNEDIVHTEDPLTEYPAFGGEILEILPEDEIISLINGKIVVVGDMNGDIHNTYAGDVPGPILNVRAYHSLRNGKHIINIFMVGFLLLLYSIIIFIILFVRPGSEPGPVRNFSLRHPIISFILMTLGWGSILFLLKILIFTIFETSIIISVPSLVFSALSMPNNYIDFRKELK